MATKKIIKRPVFDNPFLNIKLNPDGSIKRSPMPCASNSSLQVVSRDVVLDPGKKTWMRLYLPNVEGKNKLPVIFYYHGGGFVFYSSDNIAFDHFCKNLAKKTGTLVISLNFRLAPEHRLPAAYEDGVDAFHWIKATNDEWIKNYANVSNCFLFGSSSGGNLAYQAGSVIASTPTEFEPLKIKGVILHQPYFSGTKRTGSEKRLANDPLLPLYAIDKMFDLCLPDGANHDHEYCNTFANGRQSNKIDQMKRLGWRFMVTGCYDDPLVDAGMDCAKALEAKGIKVTKLFTDGYHAMEVVDPSRAAPLFHATKCFIHDVAFLPTLSML